MKINTKLVRQSYIGKIISDVAEDKNITNSAIADKLGVSQPNISSSLKGTKQASDDKFRKIGIAIGLSNKELDKIFYDADIEEMKYKYPDKFLNEINTLGDIDFDVMLSREYGINDDASIRDIKKYIEFIKNN